MKYLILLLLLNFQNINNQPLTNDVEITIESSDQMKYNLSEIRVESGQTVTLTLVHTGSLPKVAMGHNWVLLERGTDVRSFALGAMKSKDNQYLPDSGYIVATDLIGGGEQTTITFTAPSSGEYDFICSFPGHYGLMQGKLIVG